MTLYRECVNAACRKRYRPTHGRQRYCSPDCRSSPATTRARPKNALPKVECASRECSVRFVSSSGKQKYHSETCRNREEYLRDIDWWPVYVPLSEVECACETCTVRFVPIDRRYKYHSDACRELQASITEARRYRRRETVGPRRAKAAAADLEVSAQLRMKQEKKVAGLTAELDRLRYAVAVERRERVKSAKRLAALSESERDLAELTAENARLRASLDAKDAAIARLEARIAPRPVVRTAPFSLTGTGPLRRAPTLMPNTPVDVVSTIGRRAGYDGWESF